MERAGIELKSGMIGGAVHLVFAVGLLACAAASRSGGDCSWDETYASAVAAAQPAPQSVTAEEARQELEALARFMKRRAEPVAIRKRALTLGRPVEQIRLEGIIPEPETYIAVWMIRTEHAGTLLVSDKRGVRETVLSEDQWEQVVRLIREGKPRSWLNSLVSDGAAYFVSFAVGEACGQYALYAPIFSDVMPDAYRVFDQAIAREKGIVEKLLRLGRNVE